ncbi:MAG: multifunctional CCA addition/repair protein [Limnohabitans sp.]
MQVFVVGGAVRDAWLGLPVHDRDWVVVGERPEHLADQGFVPVGKDFPVFLHPRTREEYALARTERKTARGYKGFVVSADPSVRLDEDLARRDLTINAIALPEAWADALGQPDAAWRAHLIDPHGGVADLQARVLRHVTDAFAEDPVRILRVARLAARLPGFVVADATQALMRQMVQAGEVDHLVPERVWQELARGLMTAQPSRMFEVLRDCGALAVLLPELDRLWGVPQRAEHHPEVDTGVHVMLVLDMAARLQAPLTVRWAALMHDLGKGLTPAHVLPRHLGHEGHSVRLARAVAERLRVPTDCRELAEVVAREHGNIHRSQDLGAAAQLRLLTRCDAIRQPERFALVLQACECDARGRAGLAESPYPQAAQLGRALQAALSVSTAPVAAQAAAQGLRGPAIGQAIDAAREAAIAALGGR